MQEWIAVMVVVTVGVAFLVSRSLARRHRRCGRVRTIKWMQREMGKDDR